MGRAKDIVVKVLPSNAASAFIRRHHYSGKVVNNSTLHLGAFLDGKLHGVMSFGSPLDKRKVLSLVHTSEGVSCLWNEMLELNRMAFDDYLPKNSESRCLSVAFRMIRKNAPHIRWILSFSDGTQCGDGAIYRASGFALTSIKENNQTYIFPDGEIVTRMTLTLVGGDKREKMKRKWGVEIGAESSIIPFQNVGAKPLKGYQLRYIYLLDKTCVLNCPVLPFSDIDKIGAGMYRGEKITLAERRNTSVQSIIGDAPSNQSGEGGSIPT